LLATDTQLNSPIPIETTQLQLRNADGSPGLLAMITAPTEVTIRVTSHAPTATVYLISPDAPLQLDPAPLLALYAFTDAEARLACHLAAGRSLTQSARHLHVSVNTVRTHLQRALAKAQCHRQSELVIQVLKTCRRVY
jgi:DNA-binding CsgD family transcriptional regulator